MTAVKYQLSTRRQIVPPGPGQRHIVAKLENRLWSVAVACLSGTSPSETSEAQQGAPLHSHFSNDTLTGGSSFFTNWAGLFFFFCFVSFLFFFLFFTIFFLGTRLLTLRDLRYVATRLHQDLSWQRLIQNWSDAELRFALQAPTDTAPTATNLRRWGVSEVDPTCNLCGKPATLRHVLNGCPVALHQGRYTWRHNSVLTAIRHRLNTFWEQHSTQLAVQATVSTKKKSEVHSVRARRSTPPGPKSRHAAQTTCLPSHSPSSE